MITLVYPISWQEWVPDLVKWAENPHVKRDILGGKPIRDGVKEMIDKGSAFIGLQNGVAKRGFVVLTPDSPGRAEMTIYGPGVQREAVPMVSELAWRMGLMTLWGKFSLDRIDKGKSFDEVMRLAERYCRYQGWTFEAIVKIKHTGQYVALGSRSREVASG